MSFQSLIAYFLLVLNNILFSGCFSLFIHSPTKGVLILSEFWQRVSYHKHPTCSICVDLSLKPFGYVPGSMVAGSHDKSMLEP